MNHLTWSLTFESVGSEWSRGCVVNQSHMFLVFNKYTVGVITTYF